MRSSTLLQDRAEGTGEDKRTYQRELMRAERVKDPDDEDLIKFDRKRVGKTMSNADWEAPAEQMSG